MFRLSIINNYCATYFRTSHVWFSAEDLHLIVSIMQSKMKDFFGSVCVVKYIRVIIIRVAFSWIL